MPQSQFEYGLGTWDYIVVVVVIVCSTAIGLYFALRSKQKNTNTRHFLVSSSNIGIFPLILSTTVTNLSAVTVLGQPAETYSNGFQVAISNLTQILSALFSVQAILPVFFQLKLNTINQYIEYRFNRQLRIFPAVLSLIQFALLLASISHVTAIICSDALRIPYWSSMAIICGTCTLYSSVMVVLFANYIFNDAKGLPGLFIAGLLAATLSTLSSYLNSASTVVIVDFIKPLFPDLKDNKTKIYSKLVGLLYGAIIVAATVVVRRLGSLMQLLFMMTGTSIGPSTGMFILGLFFPWANSTGAMCGYVCALCICCWAGIGRFQHVTSHYSLPVRTDGCDTNAFNFVNRTIPTVSMSPSNETASFGLMEISNNQTMLLLQNNSTDDVFFLYRITPIWYYAIAVLVVVVVGMVVSAATGFQDPEKLDPRYISPLTWFFLGQLPVKYRKMIGFKSERFHGETIKLSSISNGFSVKGLSGMETSNLNPPLEKDNAVSL